MSMDSSKMYTGFSDTGIEEAISNALSHAGDPTHFEIVETLGCHDNNATCHYQAILKTHLEEGV